MSHIEHTLTADHLLKAMKSFGAWTSNGCGILSEYLKSNPLILTFELPSPWRMDIENAPRNCKDILANIEGFYESISGSETDNYWADYHGNTYEDHQITAWMEIPALPERK